MLLRTIVVLVSVSTSLCVDVDIEGLGKLKGREDVARDGTRYYSFTGVPYAQPPVGELRFKSPVPVKPWKGVKDATQYATSCLQNFYYKPETVVGSEDCLVINVHSKELKSSANKPVIVYIHGGFFKFGSIVDLSAKYMMEQDIVFVAMQYRLGALGFLTTEDTAAPGNYGLQDQLAALRWVNQNIHLFGGNKDLVTLMGHDAGGASAHYHLLSPRSEGLIKRVISLSGSALCWWANLPNQAATTNKLAKGMDCPTESSTELLNCLREKDAKEMLSKQNELFAWHPNKVETEPLAIWSPRADTEAGEDAILPVSPQLAMEVGQIPPLSFLMTVQAQEGIWRAANYINQDDVMMEFLKDFEKIAPHALGLTNQMADSSKEEVLSKIKNYYLKSLVDEKDLDTRLQKVVTKIIEMFGDSMFYYPIDRTIKLHGAKSHAKVWLVLFNYPHNHTLGLLDVKNPGKVLKPDEQITQLQRSSHSNELSMLFQELEPLMGPLSEEETEQSKEFIELIVNFAKKGDPAAGMKFTQIWTKVADGQLSHYNFGKYSAAHKGLVYQDRMKFWNSLPVFWRRVSEKSAEKPSENLADIQNEKAAEGERYGENQEEVAEEEVIKAAKDDEPSEEPKTEEEVIEAENDTVEDLNAEEEEEVQVESILQEIKDEL